MIIPKGDHERLTFFTELINDCESSRAERITQNDTYRRYFLYGTDKAARVAYNRIFPHINTVSSFLYAQETTKFSINFGAAVPEEARGYSDKMVEKAKEIWHESDTDRNFGEAVTWALVYGSMIMKPLWNGRVRTYYLEPNNFGVIREDVDSITRQEALCQTSYASVSELRRTLSSHPNRDEIMKRIDAGAHPQQTSTIPETISRVILSQTTPNMIGAANITNLPVNYDASVTHGLVEMKELWIWDDEIDIDGDGKADGGYRVVTLALPDAIIFDRDAAKNKMCLPQEHPFIKVCANPLYNYFWGVSEVQMLINIQDWRDSRLRQIDETWGRQLRPTRIMSGFPGLQEERMNALDKAGGYISSPYPTAKVETFKPELPPESLNFIRFIDEMFDEMSGLTNTLTGRGEEGVRSMGHAAELGKNALSRPRKRALFVEDALSELATMMLKIQALNDKTRYLDESKAQFLLSQVPTEYQVKVSGHTSSPIFSESLKQDAFALLQAGAITKRRLVEIVDPPMIESILEELKGIEAGEAHAAEVQEGEIKSKTVKNLRSVGVR